MDSVRVESLLTQDQFDLRLTLLAGKEGIERRIASSRIQKPGLALAGFVEHIHTERVQVFGNTELSFLRTLPPEAQGKNVDRFFETGFACLVVTKNLPVPEVILEAGARTGTPVFKTTLLSSTFIQQVENYLQEALTATTSLHGVLVDVLGVGVLILGKSGIGKSEAALDLVVRGHRLVADDIVDARRKTPDSVFGSGSEIIKHHMEIRGLGIINIKDLFGVGSVRDKKKIEMVVELTMWDESVEYDRLGIEEQKFTILDVDVPLLTIPVRPGRNLTTLIEVAARNHLLKLQGHHSAKDFQDRLNREIAASRGPRGIGEVE